MTHTSVLVRRAGVATAALGLAIAGIAAPTTAAPVKEKKAVDCVDYTGKTAKTPKGAIARDDHVVVKQDPLKLQAEKDAKAAKAAGQKNVSSLIPTEPDDEFDVTIPVRFHEVHKATGNGGGNLSDARIAAQIDALNEAYAPAGFTFVLAENDSIVKPEWWNLIGANGAEPRLFRGGGKEVAMKKHFADDDPTTLDVYSASLGQFLLGWAWFPSDFTEFSTSQYGALPSYFDGVVIDFRTVPNPEGNTEGDTRVYPDGTYEQGDTLTHEVGHWLELYHTFQGGCDDSDDGGDHISDTPEEASPNFLCPEPGDEPRDTCPADGLDPVNNFMDYSFDECLTEFTPEQAARMQFAWETYRDPS